MLTIDATNPSYAEVEILHAGPLDHASGADPYGTPERKSPGRCLSYQSRLEYSQSPDAPRQTPLTETNARPRNQQIDHPCVARIHQKMTHAE